jgi:hypothetical protein
MADTVMMISYFIWGSVPGIQFALVTIALAVLLFVRDVVGTTKYRSRKTKLIIDLAIVPLFLLFIVNLIIVFLGE